MFWLCLSISITQFHLSLIITHNQSSQRRHQNIKQSESYGSSTYYMLAFTLPAMTVSNGQSIKSKITWYSKILEILATWKKLIHDEDEGETWSTGRLSLATGRNYRKQRLHADQDIWSHLILTITRVQRLSNKCMGSSTL